MRKNVSDANKVSHPHFAPSHAQGGVPYVFSRLLGNIPKTTGSNSSSRSHFTHVFSVYACNSRKRENKQRDTGDMADGSTIELPFHFSYNKLFEIGLE